MKFFLFLGEGGLGLTQFGGLGLEAFLGFFKDGLFLGEGGLDTGEFGSFTLKGLGVFCKRKPLGLESLGLGLQIGLLVIELPGAAGESGFKSRKVF